MLEKINQDGDVVRLPLGKTPLDMRNRVKRWVVNYSTTAQNFDILHVDTSAAIKTITLPASPLPGWSVVVADAKFTFDVYNCTVARNSKPIKGATNDFICDMANKVYTFVYIDDTYGWEVYF